MNTNEAYRNSCLSAVLAIALAAVVLLLAVPAQAAGWSQREAAQQAIDTGQIQPMKAMLAKVEAENPGAAVLDADLENKNGRWLYEFKLVRPSGEMVKLRLDARDGSVVDRRVRGAGMSAARP